MPRLIAASVKGPRKYVLAAVLVALSITLLVAQRADAAAYTTPFWTNGSASQESAIEIVSERAMSPEGVDLRTGELFWNHHLFTTPGVVSELVFSFTWRSMITGSSQLGNGIVPNWEVTAQYVALIPGSPNVANGHAVDIRRGTGRIDRFMWNSTAYVAPADVFDALTTHAGNYVLTDKWGNVENFNSNGTLSTSVDRNGNTITWSHTGNKLMLVTDTRGQSFAIGHNARGYISSIADATGRAWSFGYDASDNLTTITNPSTPDQPAGSTTTLNYDGLDRLVSVTDSRGMAVQGFSYVAATGQVSTAAIGTDSVALVYTPGVTTRTDRNGGVHRSYFTGSQVTKTDMLVDGASRYATQHRYAGVFPSSTVYPRGNRVDVTFDGMGNMTTRRHRATDTAMNDPSDLVHQWGLNAGNFRTSYTDPSGNTWSIARDASGNRTGVIMPNVTAPAAQSASVLYTIDAKGRRLTETDAEGHLKHYTYGTSGNGKDRLIRIEIDRDGLDLETSLTYDNWGNVATVTDPRGNTTIREWDALGRLVRLENALGHEVRSSYDGIGNVVSRAVENVDSQGVRSAVNPWITTQFDYDIASRLSSVTKEIDAASTTTTSVEYDQGGNIVFVSGPDGKGVQYGYDERGHRITTTRAAGTGMETTFITAFDDNGNVVAESDGLGRTWTRSYDMFDRCIAVADPLGNTTTRAYDRNSRLTETKRLDASGETLQQESYVYDERGQNWKTVARRLGASAIHPDLEYIVVRSKSGLVVQCTSPGGRTANYLRDAAGRVTEVQDATGNVLKRTFDENGNIAAWTNVEHSDSGDTVRNFTAQFDGLNRMTQRTVLSSDGTSNRVFRYRYGSRHLEEREDPAGALERYAYDGRGLLVQRDRATVIGGQDPYVNASTEQLSYDSSGRLVSVIDDAGGATTIQYDAAGRIATTTLPDGSTETTEFDQSDQPVKTTDRAGNVVQNTFDLAGRLAGRTIVLASGFGGHTSETYTYDGVGRPTVLKTNQYELSREYESHGFRSYLVRETQAYVGANPQGLVVERTLDSDARRVQLSYPSSANLVLDYEFDLGSNVRRVEDQNGDLLASLTHSGNRIKEISYGNGCKAELEYGSVGELSRRVVSNGAGAVLSDLQFGHDSRGDLAWQRFGGAGSPGDAYSYDPMGRLKTAWVGAAQPESPTQGTHTKKIAYQLDPDSNRSNVTLTPWQQAMQTMGYVHNNTHEYTSVSGVTRSHDANGGLQGDGAKSFVHDFMGRVVEAKTATGVLIESYKYDAAGRRVERATAGGTTTRFVYEGSRLISTYADGLWSQNYMFASVREGPVGMEQADVLDHDADGNITEVTRHATHLDALGSIAEASDANGAVAASYRHEPFGAMTVTRNGATVAGDPLGLLFHYRGLALDPATGLSYGGTGTYHDPTTGRTLGRRFGDRLRESNPNLLREPALLLGGVDDQGGGILAGPHWEIGPPLHPDNTDGGEYCISVELSGDHAWHEYDGPFFAGSMEETIEYMGEVDSYLVDTASIGSDIRNVEGAERYWDVHVYGKLSGSASLKFGVPFVNEYEVKVEVGEQATKGTRGKNSGSKGWMRTAARQTKLKMIQDKWRHVTTVHGHYRVREACDTCYANRPTNRTRDHAVTTHGETFTMWRGEYKVSGQLHSHFAGAGELKFYYGGHIEWKQGSRELAEVEMLARANNELENAALRDSAALIGSMLGKSKHESAMIAVELYKAYQKARKGNR